MFKKSDFQSNALKQPNDFLYLVDLSPNKSRKISSEIKKRLYSSYRINLFKPEWQKTVQFWIEFIGATQATRKY